MYFREFGNASQHRKNSQNCPILCFARGRLVYGRLLRNSYYMCITEPFSPKKEESKRILQDSTKNVQFHLKMKLNLSLMRQPRAFWNTDCSRLEVSI